MTTTQTESPAVQMADIVEPTRHPLATAQTTQSGALQANATPAMLLQMAVQQGMDLTYLERLMQLQLSWEQNEARKAHVAAMAAFKAEPMPKIYKARLVEYRTRDGELISYEHAELSDITEVVVPAMAKHGLSHRWNVAQKDGRVQVTCVITHSMGHSESVTMEGSPDASGKKNLLQQFASTVTYLSRYTLLAITGMATHGMDDDGVGGPDYDNKPPPPPARSATPPPPAKPASNQTYSDAEFLEKLPVWVDKITGEKKTDPETLISFIESKGKQLTPEQQKKLRDAKLPF